MKKSKLLKDEMSEIKGGERLATVCMNCGAAMVNGACSAGCDNGGGGGGVSGVSGGSAIGKYGIA